MIGLSATCITCDTPVIVDQCDEALVVYTHKCTAGPRVHVKGLVRGVMVTQRSQQPDVVKSIGQVKA